ncbi:MAG: hypothetical protein FWH37_05475 [Candidatus Bathyarchaeota archaeon]|nr:hypothetical protein [Candidatus Termiticorpusculum sp.]
MACIVHRERPWGGCEQVMVQMWASTSPVILHGSLIVFFGLMLLPFLL